MLNIARNILGTRITLAKMAYQGSGELQMMLMGMEDGTLGVARVDQSHLVCVYAEVGDGVVQSSTGNWWGRTSIGASKSSPNTVVILANQVLACVRCEVQAKHQEDVDPSELSAFPFCQRS